MAARGPNSEIPDDEGKPEALRELRFSDPRQRRIHHRLRLIGPGAVGFYGDALRLLPPDRHFSAKSHLVGHLAREVESALRAVLTGKVRSAAAPKGAKPAKPKRAKSQPKQDDREKHKESIREAVAGLELPDQAALVDEWVRVTDGLGFHGRAHRDNLRGPRRIDDAFVRWWSAFEAVLAVVLDRYEARFDIELKKVVVLAQVDAPTEDHLRQLEQTVPHHPVALAGFFDSLKSPDWLPLLHDAGYLSPFDSSMDTGDALQFSFVPAAACLARFAKDPQAQKVVLEILKSTATVEHPFANEHLLDAIVALPSGLQAEAASTLVSWLERGLYVITAKKIGAIAASLAQGGEADAALNVIEAMLAVSRDPNEGGLGPRAQSRLDQGDLENFGRTQLPGIVTSIGMPVLARLCQALDAAVHAARSRDGASSIEDYSDVWCPSLDHARNHGNVENLLVSMTRDAALSLVEPDPTHLDGVLACLQKHEWRIFRRLETHILVAHGHRVPDAVTAVLSDPESWVGREPPEEFQQLSKAHFSKQPGEVKASILELIRRGPDTEAWVSWRTQHGGDAPTPDDQRAYVESWQRDRLSLIMADLEPADRAWYDALVDRYGEPDLDYYSVRHGSFGAPAAPLAKPELAAMETSSLVDYLRTWRPDGGHFEPSLHGLARVLQEVVAEDPQRFSKDADQFIGLHPDYLAAIFGGLTAAAKGAPLESWAPLLRLARAVVDGTTPSADEAVTGERGDGGRWCRLQLAYLFEPGLVAGASQIPIGHREDVWEILSRLLQDADPTTASEANWTAESHDVGLNCVRGVALGAVIRYALWVSRHSAATPNGEAAARSFEATPEVRAALDAVLDRERSPAVLSALGLGLPHLVRLDAEWTRSRVSRILPREVDGVVHRSAVWSAYVVFNRCYTSVFDVLHDEYDFEISRLREAKLETTHAREQAYALAQHLLVMYVFGHLPLEDDAGPVRMLLREAPDVVLGHVIGEEGRLLRNAEDDIDAGLLSRLSALWDRRLSELRDDPAGHAAELAAFATWYASGKFDEALALERLEAGLQAFGGADLDFLVLERLAGSAPSHGDVVLRCLRLMIEGDSKGWLVSANRKHVRAILSTCIASSNEATRGAARDIIGLLATRGYRDFEDLQPPAPEQ